MNTHVARVLLFSALCLAGAAAADSSGVHHVSLPGDSPVPISGWPFWIENLTTGSPLSDYGSHHGVKASVADYVDRAGATVVPKETFGLMAHYAARSETQRKWDKVFIDLPGLPAGGPITDRRIAFSPFGWEETAQAGSASLALRVTTWSRDVFLLSVEVTNGGDGPLAVTPALVFVADDEVTREAMNPISTGGDTCALTAAAGEGVIACTGSGTLTRVVRSFPGVAAARPAEARRYGFDLGAIAVPAGSSNGFSFVIAFGADEAEARAALDASGTSNPPDPSTLEGAWAAKAREWDGFFRALPPPHTDDPETARLYRMAATALRHNVYGKRNKMPADCSVPGKVHFGYFFGWDTPFHALAHREWDPALAAGNLDVIFAGQQSTGLVPYMVNDELSALSLPGMTQPPVQGFVASEIATAGGAKDTAWLAAMYEKGNDYLRYWARNRDTDKDGLYEYASGFETGWDDTPRYHCKGTSNLCLNEVTTIDALDLNTWIYLYYGFMARAAALLGKGGEVAGWEEKAKTLAANIDEKMWDTAAGCYYDTEIDPTGAAVDGKAGAHAFIKVGSPVMLWPLFAGITADPARAKAVIEGHLLDPARFWGLGKNGAPFSVPSIAYDDPTYDAAQDGYYWQGQVWLMPSYMALAALSRYGYAKEAGELRDALVSMVLAADPGGIHETYDAMTGAVGWGSGTGDQQKGGVGEPSVFQFGWSTAFVLEMLLDRHEQWRYLRADETSYAGYVREAAFIPSREVFCRVSTGSAAVPRVEVKAIDGRPLADSKSIEARFTDPYQEVGAAPIAVEFPALTGAEWSVQAIDANGVAAQVAPVEGKDYVAFTVDPKVDRYVISTRVALEGSPIPASSGCSCSAVGVGGK